MNTKLLNIQASAPARALGKTSSAHEKQTPGGPKWSSPPSGGLTRSGGSGGTLGVIVLAALAMPGVWQPAQAEAAPEEGVVAVKYLHYQDSQPGLQRIKVDAPSIYLLVPVSQQWAVEGSLVSDSVSGASPRYHTAISGASKMHEERKAGDVKVTYYGQRSTLALGLSRSAEHDYVSNALSLDARLSSADNNTTWNVGLGLASDRINPVNGLVVDQRKRTSEVIVGVTQAWSAVDLVQLNVSVSRGKGYYDDPYKTLDLRPDYRNQTALMTRWNHHFTADGSTLRSSYRWYHDSNGINSHTLQAEWVKPLSANLTLTPVLRYYTQSSASFYFNPVYDTQLGAPYPAGYDAANPPRYISLDQRLSAFGAFTLGLKAEYQLNKQWSVDAKWEQYSQRGDWRIGGGSPGLAVFNASTLMLGVSSKF